MHMIMPEGFVDDMKVLDMEGVGSAALPNGIPNVSPSDFQLYYNKWYFMPDATPPLLPTQPASALAKTVLGNGNGQSQWRCRWTFMSSMDRVHVYMLYIPEMMPVCRFFSRAGIIAGIFTLMNIAVTIIALFLVIRCFRWHCWPPCKLAWTASPASNASLHLPLI